MCARELTRTADTSDHVLRSRLLFHEARVRLRRSEDLVVLSLAKLALHVLAVLGVIGIVLRHGQKEVGFVLVVGKATGKDTTSTAEGTAEKRTTSKGIEQTAQALRGFDVHNGVGCDLESFLKRFRGAFHASADTCARSDTLENIERLLTLGHGPGDIAHCFAEHTASKQKLTSRIGQTAKRTDTESNSAITLATTSHGLAISLTRLLEDVRRSRKSDSADLRRSTGSNPLRYGFGPGLKPFLHKLVEGTGSEFGLGRVGRSIDHACGRQKQFLLSGVERLTLELLLGSFVERLLDRSLTEETKDGTGTRTSAGSKRRTSGGTGTSGDDRLNDAGSEATDGRGNPVEDAVLTDVLDIALIDRSLGEVAFLIRKPAASLLRTSKHEAVAQRLLHLVKADVEVVGDLLEEAGAADTLNILCISGRIDLLPVTFRERSFLIGILRHRYSGSVIIVIEGVATNEELFLRRAVRQTGRPLDRLLLLLRF